ncbi:ephrin-A1-like [Stylophora pistillata]|uniref:ephrin-A1-like n=1 Tax=Stylophora pistillata TaxID=50429 RepID=UPI000C0513A3|nr:ephrin-A1-like [Stylophora pistillata]
MRRENRLVLVFFYVCMELAVLVSGAIVYPSLHWTFQNPLFKGGNYRLNVLPGSKLNILCPHVAVSLEERQDTDNGLIYENFWRVDLKSYETCNVNSSITKNKIFLQCDNPRQIQFETLVFQPFNADPSRVFKKGTVYYFICKCGLYFMSATICSAHHRGLINFMMLFEEKHPSSTYD